jgi:outer membrane receptor protein involved in Fe transport
VKLSGSYDFDFGLSLGVAYQYLSGARFDHLFFNDTFQGFTDRRAPRGFDPGEDPNDVSDDFALQLPDLNQVDIRAQYSLGPLTGQNMSILVDIFNVFNRRTVTSVNQADDGTFGTVNGRQSPLQIQLGIRYVY